jgi:hypothetical protein
MWESVDWINLAQDKDKWQALVRMEMSLRFNKMWGISGLAKEFSRRTLLHGVRTIGSCYTTYVCDMLMQTSNLCYLYTC